MLRDLKNRLLVLLALAAAPFSAQAADEIETPPYETLAADGAIEVRRYAPLVEAYTSVEAESARKAANRAFMTVAGYIFGGNEGGAKIAMTAPVRSSGTRIAMTAPVRTTSSGTVNEAGRYEVAFVMPSKWTMETLPAPKDGRVKLRKVPAQTLAALRFTGEPSAQEAAAREEELRAWLDANGWAATGPAGVAGYDGPSVPSAERRYEVTVPVEKAG